LRDVVKLLEEMGDTVLACLFDQNKSGSFGGPAFIQLITAI